MLLFISSVLWSIKKTFSGRKLFKFVRETTLFLISFVHFSTDSINRICEAKCPSKYTHALHCCWCCSASSSEIENLAHNSSIGTTKTKHNNERQNQKFIEIIIYFFLIQFDRRHSIKWRKTKHTHTQTYAEMFHFLLNVDRLKAIAAS